MEVVTNRDRICRWWLQYRNDDKFILGASKTFSKLSGYEIEEWLLYSWKNITIDVVSDARLADEFDCGKTKLVPVILSHDRATSRVFYSTFARELASNGCIVFLLDHHDASCIYTQELRDSKFSEIKF